MRKIAVPVIFILVSLQVVAQNKTLTFSIDKKNKIDAQCELVLNEEFNGSALNEDLWLVREGVTRDAAQKITQQWLTKESISVKDGKAFITTLPKKRTNQPFSVWITDGMKPFTGNFGFDTGEFESKADFFYGYYEIKCKLPKGHSAWPAFWLYGEANGTNNEIDVFEFWNEENAWGKFSSAKLSRIQHMTTHYNKRMNGIGVKLDFDASTDFHTYGVLWTPQVIIWYTDGKEMRRLFRYEKKSDRFAQKPKGKEGVFPQSPMKIIVDMAVQQSKMDIPQWEQPLFEIEYIRGYKLK
jgi:beta-glucanase (GH16 family)